MHEYAGLTLTVGIGKMITDAPKVMSAKVEADENMRLAGRYKLRGFPTVLVFRNGELRDQFSGAKPAGFVRDFIAPFLGA